MYWKHNHIWQLIPDWDFGDKLQIYRCKCGQLKLVSLDKGKVLILSEDELHKIGRN